MIFELIQFFKKHENDIVLFVGVILISLLSFAVGYITAKEHQKEPIRIEYEQKESKKSSCYRSRNYRPLFGTEAVAKRL
jgi:hypothetical protein